MEKKPKTYSKIGLFFAGLVGLGLIVGGIIILTYGPPKINPNNLDFVKSNCDNYIDVPEGALRYEIESLEDLTGKYCVVNVLEYEDGYE